MMRKTVVVPLLDPQVDHVGVSERALPYARRLLELSDARLLLVSVIDMAPEFDDLAGTASDELLQERTEWIADRREYLEGLAADFPEGRVDTVVRSGNATSQVLDLLANLDRPMLVMGSHARTGSARMLYGSVTFRLLHGADAPVMVVRRRLPEPAQPGLQQVLVPLDGSVFAEQVLESVIDSLGQQPLHFHLLHVIDLARNPPDDPIRKHGLTPYQWAKRYLPRVVESLEARGHAATWQISDGSVPDEITQAAQEQGCDLIAMSTNSRGGLSRLIYGSVAEKVLSAAGVPLLLVRPEESAVPFAG
jgi:nucleotide-binding universal stress UspA family protein